MRLLACVIILCAPSVQAFQPASPDLAVQARGELYAGRNDYAAALFQKLADQEPARGDAYDGLVRALLKSHKSHDAYAAAAVGLEKAPQTSGAQTAAGMAAFRQGELAKAETYFKAAYKIDPKNPGALLGMASICSMVSKLKCARDATLEAYRYAPDDPALMLAKANSLKGADHIAALEKVLAIYDPESDEARGLRAHIAIDRAIGERKTRRLTSTYESTSIKLLSLWDGPQHLRGVGLRVRFNDRENATLLLDTGASGISLSTKLVEKSGLEELGHESREAKGIGDERSQDALEYLASTLQIGDVKFENYTVSVFRSAKTQDYDGLIGADVFQRFLVGIDFVKMELALDPRPKTEPASGDEPEDAGNDPAPGFTRAFRFGNHMTIFTAVNQHPGQLFLIDSGSSSNLIDETVARASAPVEADDRIQVRGIQGKAAKVAVAQHVSLIFAGLRQDNPDLIAINLEKLGDSAGVAVAGILGMPVLIHTKLSIDYRDGTVRLEYKR